MREYITYNARFLVVLACLIAFGASFLLGLNYGKSLRIKYNPPTIVKPEPPQIHFHYYTPQNYLKKKNKLQAHHYSDPEKYCMAQNIYFESANQSALGKLAVGLVVINRVKDSRYPGTICGVVRQKSQFSWVNDERSNEPKKDDAAWKESVRIADDVLNGRADFLEFDEVTHYHADYVNPYWSGSMEEVATIDQHVFYRN
jgi:spore germination cell wall hydrolase CwlJ-like protein